MDERTEIPGVFRSGDTGALINKDNKSLDAYKKRKHTARLVPLLENRVSILENIIERLEERIVALETKE